MIARIWHGMTPKSKADDYVDILHRTGVQEYQATAGNLGVHILRRDEGDQVHFLTLTFWDSVEAINRFAGEEYEKARYYPEDEEYLLEFEEKVLHYEVVSSAASKD